jgi:hypothetical protein
MPIDATNNITVRSSGDTFGSSTADEIQRTTVDANNSILFPNKIPNPLHNYNSFNTIFTLACLTPEEINFPYRLRVKSPTVTILRSGGSGVSKLSTLYDLDFDGGGSTGIRREYFINNVQIKSILSPNDKSMTNANKIDFTVFEPYSMGTFIETIRLCAVKAGYKNYTQAPFCLIMEFVGIDLNNKLVNIADQNSSSTKRIIPMLFSQVNFTADQSGATYQVSAIAQSEYAMRNTVQSITNDVSLRGLTVQEFLQLSLQEELNKDKKKKNKQDQKKPTVIDDIIINFPKQDQLNSQSTRTGFSKESDKATYDPTTQRTELVGTGSIVFSYNTGISYVQSIDSMNTIGKAKMNFTDDQTKNVLTDDEKTLWDSKKKISKASQINSTKEGLLSFKKGARIEDVITNVILYSDYAKSLLGDSDANGFKNWFKVVPRVFYINDSEILEKTGAYPKLIVFDVIEHKVHESLFVKPNKKTNVEKINNFVVKEYDYLFTGKNLDVLKFDIQINAALVAQLPSDHADSKEDPNKKTKAEKETQSNIDNSKGDTTKNNTGSGITVTNMFYSPRKATMEAVGELSTEQKLALEFHDFITTGGVAFAQADLTILGDPYFIADSGIGNYYAQMAKNANGTVSFVNKDGSMDPNFTSIYIVLNFRTPIDYASNGQTIFKDTASQLNKSFAKLDQFSGVFRVSELENIFENGVFRQELKLVRVANQEIPKDQSTKTKNTEEAMGMSDAISNNAATDDRGGYSA